MEEDEPSCHRLVDHAVDLVRDSSLSIRDEEQELGSLRGLMA